VVNPARAGSTLTYGYHRELTESSAAFHAVHIGADVLGWMTTALKLSHQDERIFHEQAVFQ